MLQVGAQQALVIFAQFLPERNSIMWRTYKVASINLHVAFLNDIRIFLLGDLKDVIERHETLGGSKLFECVKELVFESSQSLAMEWMIRIGIIGRVVSDGTNSSRLQSLLDIGKELWQVHPMSSSYTEYQIHTLWFYRERIVATSLEEGYVQALVGNTLIKRLVHILTFRFLL